MVNENFKAVSFDIFDTLVCRKVANPNDVFRIVARILFTTLEDQENFYKKRLLAKGKARFIDRTYSIDDVYDVIDLPKTIAEKAKAIEKKVEISVSYQNDDVYIIFQKMIQNQIPVYLITDMYLDRDTVESILKKCQISGYKKLYISQEAGCEKLRGQLFKKVLADNNLHPRELLHIGDNLKSDVISAKLLGIKVHHVTPKILVYDDDTNLAKHEKSEYSFIQTNIRLGISDLDTEWKKIGYECLGPILWGFSNWLNDQLTKDGIQKVFFLSREGEILKEAFEILHPERLSTHYLYVSRRSLTVPLLAKNPEFDEIVKIISFPKHLTLRDFLSYIGADQLDIKDEIKNFDLDEVVDGWTLAQNHHVKKLYHQIREKVSRYCMEQYDFLKKYLEQNAFDGNVAIVDIGWNGTMQNAIEKIVDQKAIHIHGYYLGVNENNKLSDSSEASGYIYGPNQNIKYQYYIMGMSGPLEMMTTAHHGTTLSYVQNGNIIEPNLATSEYFGGPAQPEAETIDEMQYGALTFVNQMKKDAYLADVKVSGRVAFQNFFLFGRAPVKTHRNMFYGMKEYDGTVSFTMLDPTRKNIIGTNSIIDGFWKSSWKIGYMKDKFLLPIPYEDIYRMMRKKRK